MGREFIIVDGVSSARGDRNVERRRGGDDSKDHKEDFTYQ